MRRVVAVLLLAGALAGCSSARDRREPSTVPPSSSFTPVRVSVAAPPSYAWTKATRCPTEAAAKTAFGAKTRAQDSNAEGIDTGCVYGLAPGVSIEVTVILGTVETNRSVWTRPPADVVRDASELGPGVVLVYTPPRDGDQCLVAVDRPDGTLTVQVTRRDRIVGRQQLCAPLGPMLRLLAAR